MTPIHLVFLVVVSISVDCNGFKLPKETKENFIPSDLLSDSNMAIGADNFGIEDDSFVSASKRLLKENKLDDEYGNKFDSESIFEFLKRIKRARDSDRTERDQSNNTRSSANNHSKETSNQNDKGSTNRDVSNRNNGKTETSGSGKDSSQSSSSKNRDSEKNKKNSSGKNNQNSKNDNKNSGKTEKNNIGSDSSNNESPKSKDSGKSEKSNSNKTSSNSNNQETGKGDDQDEETKTDDEEEDLTITSKLHDLLAIPGLIKHLVHRAIKFIDDDDKFHLFTGPDLIINRFKDLFKALRF